MRGELPGEVDRFAQLNAAGLNLQAVWNVSGLPDDLLASLDLYGSEPSAYTQLVLIGHRGRDVWTTLQARGLHGSDPLDQFVTETLRAWMHVAAPGAPWKQLFPGETAVNLQRLGALAGWHHPSPFGLGVDAEWGSWFAYRALVLTTTHWPTTPARSTTAPCPNCVKRPCVAACPVGALSDELTPAARLQSCVQHRIQPASSCADRCLARLACPVGAEHRYSDAQMRHHYLQSLPVIREHFAPDIAIIAR